MDAHKKALDRAALVALVTIGKDAVPVLSDILAGKDIEVVELGRTRASENDGDSRSFVRVAAKALGAIGRPEAKNALLRAQKAPDSAANIAAIARALTALPASTETAKAFRVGYDKVTAPNLRADLLEAAANLYDAERVPWMLAQAKQANATQASYVRQVALRSAIRTMKPAQVAGVRLAVDTLGAEADKSAFEASSRLLERCASDLDCYLGVLGDPEDSVQEAPGVKAAAMVALLGDAGTATKIVARLAEVRSRAVRLAALGAVDHLVEKDGAAAADALMKSLDDGADEEVRTATRLVALRLRAR